MKRKPEEAGAAKVVALPIEAVRSARGETRQAVPRSKVATLRAFQRIRADRVFGVSGVVLVVAASILIFTWERQIPQEPRVELAWREDDAVFPERNETVTEQNPVVVLPFDIEAHNLTRVRVNVFRIDDVAVQAIELDNLSVILEGPPGSGVRLERNGLSCCLDSGTNETFSVRVQDTPDAPSQFDVATVEEAQQILGDRASQNGTGLWRVTLRLNQANDHHAHDLQRGAPCPQGSPESVCIPDEGNWVRVRFAYFTYRAEFRAV